jgi:tripeptidyl-peptidase-1
MQGSQTPIGGTSCSAPIVAGLFSLINGVRLKAGKTSVGFINPAIYTLNSQNPNAFYDVTQGSNPDGSCPGFRK